MFNGSPLDKRPLWYSNPVGEKTPVVDEWGNETGESAYESWSEPAKLMLNVSPPIGSAEANPFGAFTDYSYVVSSSSKSATHRFMKVRTSGFRQTFQSLSITLWSRSQSILQTRSMR